MNEEISEQQEEVKETPITKSRKFRSGLIAALFVSLVALGATWAFTVPLTTCTHKPAIYLYSPTPVSVNIKLGKAIKHETVIPKYVKKGWNVEADNTGFIRDLQPKYTKCDKLPHDKPGFEYSKDACKYNKYPYIYWDGSVKQKLDTTSKGFVVKKEDIYQFLGTKADELGLNKNEKHEFIAYWAKQVKESSGKYFKISFIQNEEVDAIFPIIVQPKPQSYNRVQIIIKKCGKNEKAEPQKLTPITRDGLTLVEWGGVIK